MENKSELTKRTQAISNKYLQYIIDCIDSENYGKELSTDKEKLQFLHDTFVSEYWYENNQKRYGTKERAFHEWIMGLPSCFNIVFSNYDILCLAKKMGSLPETASEKQEDKIIENYFSFITSKTFRLFRKYKIV